jgi:apolipoprotein N-acyltransferase
MRQTVSAAAAAVVGILVFVLVGAWIAWVTEAFGIGGNQWARYLLLVVASYAAGLASHAIYAHMQARPF